MTRPSRPFPPTLPAAVLATLLAAACQAPVRPDRDDPPEPVAIVAVTPAPVAPPIDAVPEPEPPAAPDPVDTGGEVFDRMTARFSAPICVKGDRNRAWRRRYAGHPASFARHVESILPLMAYVLEEVERKDLPGEFVLIPIVESWYRPAAIGPGGPAGMWQMIASTARNHGIRIQDGYDGRLSPVESTEAALSYLQTVSAMFDREWRATAMGYNAGENRIIRAFTAGGDRRVSGEHRLPRGLSNTSYDYVAKLHALACLFAKPARHGLALPRDAHFLPLVRIELPAGAQSLDQAAATLGTDAARLRELNPAYRQGRIVAAAPRQVLAPMTSLTALAIVRGTADPAPPSASGDAGADDIGRTHRVGRGDTLSRIAARYGISLAELFRINGLDRRSVLHPGQIIRLDP
jgi:membrane-bound lytic murein transglycosylase D